MLSKQTGTFAITQSHWNLYVWRNIVLVGHTFFFSGFSLLLLFSTLYNNTEDIKIMKENILNVSIPFS